MCKPRGASSHQMVSVARRLFHQKRVGHAGTLDPLAEGVLPVLLGRATRLADYVSGGDKVYYAEVILGTVTSTDDLEGETISVSAAPELRDAQIRQILDSFIGEVEQIPPVYSAIKLGGQTSYRRVRRGEHVELVARRIRIDEIRLIRRTANRLSLVIGCGKGTYIRALARDIGQKLGCGATLGRLIRLRVGHFDLRDAVTPAELDIASDADALGGFVLPPDNACLQLNALRLDQGNTARAFKGQGWPAEPGENDTVRTYTDRGTFLGLGRREPDHDENVDRTWWRLRVMVGDA
jgi:tRNA pseudouridine55 synthase